MGSAASKAPPAPRSVSAPPEVNATRRNSTPQRAPTSQSAKDFRRQSCAPSTSSNQYHITRDYTIQGVGYVIPNEQGPPVVLGFKPEYTGQVTSIKKLRETDYELEMDTSRDLTLSRILAADEFLARMSETDQRISNYSAVADQDSVYNQLQDLMGLRGHLQDELLRIQAMMTDDDPELNNLEEFAHIYPHVVARIRELAARAKVIEAVATGDTPTSSRSSGVNGLSQSDSGVQLDPAIIHTIQQQVSKGQQTDKATVSIASISATTQQELKDKHRKEEQEIAADYAKRLASGGRSLPPHATQMILDQHLASMQALRQKQDQEQKLFELTHSKVPSKPVAKVTAMPAGSQNKDSDESDSDGSAELQNMQETQVAKMKKRLSPDEVKNILEEYHLNNNKPQLQGGSENEANRSQTEAETQASYSQTEKEHLQNESIYTQTEAVSNQQEKGYSQTETEHGQRDVAQSHTNADYGNNDASLTQTEADYAHNEAICTQTEADYAHSEAICTQTEADYAHSTRTDADYAHNEATCTQTEADYAHGTQTEADYAHSEATCTQTEADYAHNETICTQTWAVYAHNEATLSLKEAEEVVYRQAEAGCSVNDVTDEDDSEDEYTQADINQAHSRNPYITRDMTLQDIRRLSDSVVELTVSESEADSEDEDLTNQDKEFIKKIKKKGKISQKEFDELLAAHLAATEALRKQRRHAATRSDELLRAKLKQRSGRIDAEDEETSEALEELNEKLRRRLVERRKDMGEEELQALLAQYRKDKEQLLAKRGNENDRHDDLLKRKLDENKRKKESLEKRENGEATAEDLEKIDDKFFQELQRKLQNGEITQEAFSSMLKNYLNTIDSNRAKQRRLEQRKLREKKHDEDARNEASNLVHESLELKRQITSIRNREREAFDEQLKNKLARKGKISPVVEVGDP